MWSDYSLDIEQTSSLTNPLQKAMIWVLKEEQIMDRVGQIETWGQGFDRGCDIAIQIVKSNL